MQTFSEIIDLWPTAAAFSRDIGVSDVNARAMRRDNRLPSTYWDVTVQRAKERGFEGVTLEVLSGLAAAKREPAQ